MVSTRRSSKESDILCKHEKKYIMCKTYVKRKKTPQEEKHQQQAPQQEENHQQQEPEEEEEDHLATPPSPVTAGRVVEGEVENMGVEEVLPLDISSDEEETKPPVDHLSFLNPVSKPPSDDETSQEDLKILKNAARIVKDVLVSYLEKTAHKLDTLDMVSRANDCFTGLKTLKVDYEAFHGEVRKFIKHTLELIGAREKHDLELKVAYEMSVSDVNDAREELIDVQYNLMNAKTNYNHTLEKIETLKVVSHRLEEEAATERDEIENLTSKREICEKAFSLAERIKEPYEEIMGSPSRLRELV